MAHAAPGDIFNLGTVGGSYSSAWAISDTAQASGSSYPIGDNQQRAFRYSGMPGAGGTMVDIGTLGGTEAAGYAINDAGQVAGESSTTGNVVAHAFRYTGTPGAGGSMADLGALGGTRSAAYGINNSGQVVGQANLAGNVTHHAFRYTGIPGAGGAMADLGTLGGTVSSGNDINDAGQVTGYATTTGDIAYHAFRYTGTPGAGGAMVDLGSLGGTFCIGNAINKSGQVAGVSDTGEFDVDTNPINHAFFYTGTPGAGGAMFDLQTLGGLNSSANGMNDAGYVVGQAQRSTGTDEWATLWLNDAGHTAIDLDAWLDAVNPTAGALWTLNLSFAQFDINNNGLVSGVGLYDDGSNLGPRRLAFMLDVSSLVPEPSSFMLAALGVIGLLVVNPSNDRLRKHLIFRSR
jgi:probable HAF family extracellular repeat protein